MGSTSTYKAFAAMGNLWNYLQGLALSYDERRWLADTLLEVKEEKTKKKLVFPRIGDNMEPSAELLDKVLGSVPDGFDIDKELSLMWEERAK